MTPIPYLPDIFEGIVARVNTIFSTRPTDPFTVYYDKGIYTQVAKNIYKLANATFPLVWLVMNFVENFGDDLEIAYSTTAHLIIAMPTDEKFTQEQRDEQKFKPRLIPIYDTLIDEIWKDENLQFEGPKESVKHKRSLNPYWGGGPTNGTDNKNLFDNYIDAIQVIGLELKIKNICI